MARGRFQIGCRRPKFQIRLAGFGLLRVKSFSPTIMPTWLQQSFHTNPTSGTVDQMAWRVVVAFFLGCVVAQIYRSTHRAEPITPSFPRTLVLLSILMSMVTQVIGDNFARAFGLAGALSIVRFRTVVRDAQDTAFVIFAVVVGMAAGADYLWIALIGTVVIAVAILILRPRKQVTGWSEEECELELRFALGTKPEELLAPVFATYVQTYEIREVGTAQKGTCLELLYRMRLRPGVRPFDLISDLNKLEGLQSVELARAEQS